MRLSKIIALFSWFNTFVLVWLLMYGPRPEHRGIVIAGQIFFVSVAIIASLASAQNERSR